MFNEIFKKFKRELIENDNYGSSKNQNITLMKYYMNYLSKDKMDFIIKE